MTQSLNPYETINMLDVTEHMSTQYKERHTDIINWPWKLFCAKWIRLNNWNDQHQEEQEFTRLYNLHNQERTYVHE